MVHDLVPPDALCVAGDLAAARDEIVAPGEFRRNAELAEDLRHGSCKAGEIQLRTLRARHDEGEVQVPEVVEHRASPRQTAHDRDAVFLDEREIDLRIGILVPSEDHRSDVSPEHEDLPVLRIQKILLRREVEIRIGRYTAIKFHVGSASLKRPGTGVSPDSSPRGSSGSADRIPRTGPRRGRRGSFRSGRCKNTGCAARPAASRASPSP